MDQQSKMVKTKKARSETPPGASLLRKGVTLQRSAVSPTPPLSLPLGKDVGMSKESRFSYDFSQIPVHSDTKIAASNQVADVTVATLPPIIDAVQRAATDGTQFLNTSVRGTLEESLDHDFSRVRVHQGPASELAAHRLGARAYTLGRDIYLGAEANHLSRTEHERLLAHEAVHTVQQGDAPVAPQGSLRVSSPTDAAEVEADQIARSVMTNAGRPASPSLALRDQLRATPVTRSRVSRVPAPLIQRDLTGDHKVKDGIFTLNLKTESHPGAKNGMSGTIKFNANDKAPDSTNIKLLQVVRDQDLTTGKEYVWTGSDADRNKMMTAEDKTRGIQPGYHVDVLHGPGKPAPRTKASDPRVSPYYQDYVPTGSPAVNYAGSKKGKTIKEASLWDYPGSAGNRRFSFETAAKATDSGYVYGTVYWGFTISDASKGKVNEERAVGRNVTTLNFDEALKKFNEFYKNPGASTAPK